MSAATVTSDAGRRAAGGRAWAHFLDAGFEAIEPPILQPAGRFLDMSGEEIRGRLYLTSDASGEELCLRPDYTIPVCLAHLTGPAPDAPAQYAYLGPVFRAAPGQSGERLQTGFECYGRRDIEAADAEMLDHALAGAARAGAEGLRVRIGDVRMFDGVIGALGLSDAWRRRVRRGLAQGKALTAILEGAGNGASAQSGVLAALEKADHAGAKALVKDLIAIAGIATVGGRDVAEIADRFLEQAAERAEGGVGAEPQAILTRFLAISGDPDASAEELRSLADDAGLELEDLLTTFEERNGFIASRGLPIETFRYDPGFVRDLDYYTGFVFEAAAAGARPVMVGGRYDGLARRMGAKTDIPAIGAAIWVDRLPLKEA